MRIYSTGVVATAYICNLAWELNSREGTHLDSGMFLLCTVSATTTRNAPGHFHVPPDFLSSKQLIVVDKGPKGDRLSLRAFFTDINSQIAAVYHSQYVTNSCASSTPSSTGQKKLQNTKYTVAKSL